MGAELRIEPRTSYGESGGSLSFCSTLVHPPTALPWVLMAVCDPRHEAFNAASSTVVKLAGKTRVLALQEVARNASCVDVVDKVCAGLSYSKYGWDACSVPIGWFIPPGINCAFQCVWWFFNDFSTSSGFMLQNAVCRHGLGC